MALFMSLPCSGQDYNSPSEMANLPYKNCLIAHNMHYAQIGEGCQERRSITPANIHHRQVSRSQGKGIGAIDKCPDQLLVMLIGRVEILIVSVPQDGRHIL